MTKEEIKLERKDVVMKRWLIPYEKLIKRAKENYGCHIDMDLCGFWALATEMDKYVKKKILEAEKKEKGK